MVNPVRIGLVGCGRAAERIYLPVFSQMIREFSIVAAADPMHDRREIIRSRFPGCIVYASAKELIEKPGIDAVMITAPPDKHLEIAILSLRSHLHVFVEKPLSVSLSGTDELKSLSFAGKIMVGFNRRYWKPVKDLRDIIVKNRDQSIDSAIFIMRSDIRLWSPICGKSDLLDDLGSHQIDMIRYIFNEEILSISARRNDTESISMIVTLENGVSVNCLLSYGDRSYESISINIGGSNFSVMTGSDRITPSKGFARSVKDISDMIVRRISSRSSSFKNSYAEELKDFHYCITAGKDPKPGIIDGITAVTVLDAARRSLDENGQEVLILK